MFIDEVTIAVESGHGGRGCCSFRREKYVPRGGPDGGDGGDGGDVIFRVDAQLNTLHDFRYQRHLRAGRGAHGEGKGKTGRRGEHAVICVPPGTILRDEKGALIRDMVEDGQELVLLAGGRGGRGNARFATARVQAPRRADPGQEGAQMVVRLELKLLADVGLVGFPNAGKSTLLARLSAARPKIADYPFTTLEPNLGIVQWAEGESFVLADLPGLIEGAHAGKGLGTRFLRHIERTRILLFAIDCTGPDLCGELEALRRELEFFDAGMRHKPAGIALTKADLLGPDAGFKDPFGNLRAPRFLVSAISGRGMPEMVRAVGPAVKKLRAAEVEQSEPEPPGGEI